MFHRIIFLLYIVSSLSCNLNRCAFCFQSLMNIACRSTQNAALIKRFLRLHIVIKLWKIINIINSLLCWGVTLLKFIQTLAILALQIWRLSKVRTDWPKRCCWKFWNGFDKSPRLIVLNIDRMQFFLKNYEILHSVRGMCYKYSAS